MPSASCRAWSRCPPRAAPTYTGFETDLTDTTLTDLTDTNGIVTVPTDEPTDTGP